MMIWKNLKAYIQQNYKFLSRVYDNYMVIIHSVNNDLKLRFRTETNFFDTSHSMDKTDNFFSF